MLKSSWKGIILSTQVCFVVILFTVPKPFIDISREISKELTEKQVVIDDIMHQVVGFLMNCANGNKNIFYFQLIPSRPTGHWCPENVIAYIFTIKLLHLLFTGTIDQVKVTLYKKTLKNIKWCYKFLVTWLLILLIFII